MPKIRLCQYGPYNMRHAIDQANLYRVLAKLLWYLSSGKSHVGYLTNSPSNPFVAKEVSYTVLPLAFRRVVPVPVPRVLSSPQILSGRF